MTSTTTVSLTLLQKLLCLAGCGVFFAVAYFTHGLMQHSEVDVELDHALREVDKTSPGWRLADLERARAAVPNDENSALDVERAARHLPPDWSSWEPRRLIYILSRHPYALTDQEKQSIQLELNMRKEALDEAQPLAGKPRGRYTFVLDHQPWTMSMNHVMHVALVVHLLTLDAICRADAGDMKGAARSCRSAINAARSLGDEPFVMAQLMRKNQATVALRGVQYLLNHGEVELETLVDLQRQLEAEADHPAYLIAMRGHRAMLQEILDAVESGKVTWDQLFPDQSRLSLLDWGSTPSRDEIRHQHAAVLPFLGRMIDVAGKPSPERAARLHDLQSELNGGDFPLLGPLLRDLPGVEDRFAARNAHLRCAEAAVACERYRCEHDCWPVSLEALTPDYLKETPLDPADGKPLGYQLLDDNVVISSRCVDDRGRQYRADEAPSRSGVMMRLWNVSLRGTPRPPELAEEPPRGMRRPPELAEWPTRP